MTWRQPGLGQQLLGKRPVHATTAASGCAAEGNALGGGWDDVVARDAVPPGQAGAARGTAPGQRHKHPDCTARAAIQTLLHSPRGCPLVAVVDHAAAGAQAGSQGPADAEAVAALAVAGCRPGETRGARSLPAGRRQRCGGFLTARQLSGAASSPDQASPEAFRRAPATAGSATAAAPQFLPPHFPNFVANQPFCLKSLL